MPIEIEKLNFIYAKDMPFEYTALKDIDLKLQDNKFYALIGKTGSGKSTLIQHLNALLIGSSGKIKVNNFEIYTDKKNKNLKNLRKEVGVVFQFSEQQLFEETVLKDVMFGPLNFKVSESEAKAKAIKYLKLVGIDEKLFEKSPFELSGGQKRKVAIAGILALEPQILVLDEPTAGLDPESAKEILEIFFSLNKTIILVTHDFDLVYSYADEVIFLDNGNLITKKETVDFFTDDELISKYQLELPSLLNFQNKLSEKGFSFTKKHKNLKDLIEEVIYE